MNTLERYIPKTEKLAGTTIKRSLRRFYVWRHLLHTQTAEIAAPLHTQC